MRVTPLLSLFAGALVAVAQRSASEAAADGNRLLGQGAYGDAARAYGEAIDADPTSYINYYKRATAYLSLGRHAAAIDDFDAIIKLNPEFSQAHLQKAKILAKDGEFGRAADELRAYEACKNKKPADEAEATALRAQVAAAAREEKSARAAAKNRKWEDCVTHTSRALEVGPNAAPLRELRVQCNTELGEAEGAYGDLSRLAILRPSSQELRMRLAYMSYFLLDTSIAVNEVKKCLHFDPDNKGCKRLHKLFRALERDWTKARNFIEGGTPRKGLQLLRGEEGVVARFDAAMNEALAAGEIPPQFHTKDKSKTRASLYALACRAAVDGNDFTAKSAAFCDVALALDPENESALVFRGERLLKEEKWDEAVAAFQRAFEISGRQSQDVMNRMQKAQRLLKQSKQKDYYKVLGVARDADERTIKRAFRKAAKANHPDVGGSEEKMATINEAYEVLSDPELRARFDAGDDPNDPTGGQGGNPFSHHGGGGMPFFFQQGGGGFPGGGFPGGGFPGGGFPGGGGHGQKFHFQWGG